ncbi:MAG: hypothetical protein LIO75_08560, partial [Lachnospiraceae bacterium]|nr:hypothetical protein [Lachnospiraceae bacterium]
MAVMKNAVMRERNRHGRTMKERKMMRMFNLCKDRRKSAGSPGKRALAVGMAVMMAAGCSGFGGVTALAEDTAAESSGTITVTAESADDLSADELFGKYAERFFYGSDDDDRMKLFSTDYGL